MHIEVIKRRAGLGYTEKQLHVIGNTYNTVRNLNKRIKPFQNYTVCVAMWSLVIYSNYFKIIIPF